MINFADRIKDIKSSIEQILQGAEIYLPGGRNATNSFEFEIGAVGYFDGLDLSDNPYRYTSLPYARWRLGWLIASTINYVQILNKEEDSPDA